MSISNAFAQDLMDLIFHATAIANVADNAAAAPLTALHVALHYDDPGEGGTMLTNEASYASYARVSKNRAAAATGGFAAATATDPPTITFFGAETCDFPESTGAEPNGGGVLDFFAVGRTGGGAVDYFFSGAVSPTITVAGAGVTPRLTNATSITLD